MILKAHLITIIVTIFCLPIFAQESVPYYISKEVNYNFEEATDKLKSVLKEQGFGTITEIDMQEKLAEKDFNIKPYKILGVCNPKFAYQTLLAEENIGLFLPCKVLVKYIDKSKSEIVMVNPSVLMGMLGNKDLIPVAEEVTDRFKKALKDL